MVERYPKVSVVILNYNGLRFLGDLLERCLSSVLNTDYPELEVIFIDNDSSDGSLEYLVNKFRDPRLRFIKLPKNYVFCIPNNLGASLASGKYLAFLNNDILVPPDWLKNCIKYLDQRIKVVFPKMVLLDDPTKLDTTGHLLHILGFGLEKHQLGDRSPKIFGSKGAAMIVERELFLKLGGFDPKFKIYFEETDFCWRCWLHGFQVKLAPDSMVYHKAGATYVERDMLLSLFFLRQRNTLISLLKNLELGNLVKFLPLRLLWELAGMIYMRRNPDLVLMNLLALIHVLAKLRYILARRIAIQARRKIRDSELIRAGLMIRSLIPLLQVTRARFREFLSKLKG